MPICGCFLANLAAEGLALCSLNLGRSPFSGWNTATGCYYNTSKPVYRPPWCSGSWSGVSCDSSSYSINSLSLWSPGEWLSGFSSKRTIPISIANLKGLTSLTLYNMGYTGPIPTALCSLTKLNYLYPYYNSLTGTIPTAIANLKRLDGLDLSGNRFNGTLPAVLLKLPQLRTLSMGQNSLSGLPSTIHKNTVLNQLYLGDNRMIGTFPRNIVNLTNLYVLDLSTQRSCNWSYIRQSWVLSCSSSGGLSGTLPAELYILNSLYALRLSGNRLSGTISPLISQLTSLGSFELSGNRLSGTIPSSISTFTNLYDLTLDNNYFTGTIPKVFPNLNAYITDGSWYNLLLHNNYFTGAIPSMAYSYGQFVYTFDQNCLSTSSSSSVYLGSQTHCKPGTAGQLTPTAFPSPSPTPCT